MFVEVDGKSVRLPDFFIVGAAKSGTTSLAKYLVEHPDIYIPKEKELHFFAFANQKPSYYEEHILGSVLITNFDDYCKYFKNVEESKVLGEASVTYLYHGLVDNVIKHINNYYGSKKSDLKIIIILRNPIDRAFSQYVTRLSQQESLPFVKACNEWSKREKENWSIAYDYIGFSLYYQSVRKYMESFKYVKICLYEDLIENPVKTIQEIYKFLDVDSSFVPENINKKYNVSRIPKNNFYKVSYNVLIRYNPVKYLIKTLLPNKIIDTVKGRINNKFFYKPKLDKVSRKKMQEVFKDDILKLQSLIERDLSHWLQEEYNSERR